MTKNIKDITMDEEEKLDALRQDFFSYYRRMRSNLFSETRNKTTAHTPNSRKDCRNKRSNPSGEQKGAKGTAQE